jgi:hypothetical protein
MPVIGTLTVDLVANTAAFSGDMGKASKSAEDFGKGMKEAGHTAEYSMHEAKASMAIAGEELGIHLPRHIRALIAEIPMVGEAFAALLPIIGAAFSIKLIAEWYEAHEKAAHELEEAYAGFGINTQKVFNGLDDKLLSAGIKADELAGHHLAALKKQLELIDHQSLSELAQQFNVLAKASDAVFSHLKSSWYEIGAGSKGAAHALDEFKNEYEALLAQGKNEEAGDLLAGTLASAKKIQELQKLATQTGKGAGGAANIEAINKLQEESIGFTDREIAAQNKLVEALNAQLTVQQKVAALAQAEKTNDVTKEAQREAGVRQKAHEDFLKLQNRIKQEVAKDKKELAGEEEKSAQDINKILNFRLTSGLHAEIKAGEKRIQLAEDNKKKLIAVARDEAERLNELDDFVASKKAAEAQKIKAAEDTMRSEFARTAAQSLTSGKSMLAGFEQMGSQMLQAAAQNMIQMALIGDMKQAKDAGHAAASAFKWVMQDVPFPFNAALAPAAAAAAFAGVMAFEHGGEIPGSGAVPIIAHGGETVVTKALTDQVKGNVGGGAGHSFHFAPVIHAIHQKGVEGMLQKHATVFERHVTAQLRKMHKGA